MPDDSSGGGKIDDLSRMLGQLIEGQRALDRYTHEHAHDVGNLSGKVDALHLSIRKQFEELESRINRRIEDTAMQLRADTVALRVELGAANAKIAALEAVGYRQQGVLSVGSWIMRSPVVGWIAAAAVVIGGLFAREKGL
jgi:tRNA A37 N6-isopentenylltransferase MiaA